MRLTPRQANKINEIIQEEVQDALRGRKVRAEHLRRSEIQERLTEVDAMGVDMRISGEQIEKYSNDISLEIADDVVYKFRQRIMKGIAEIMNQHAMSYVKMNPRTLNDELEDFDADSLMEVSMEATTAISAALDEYAKKLAGLAVFMAGGNDEDE